MPKIEEILKKLALDYRTWESNYYLANKEKPPRLREPSTQERTDWYAQKITQLLEEKEERKISVIVTQVVMENLQGCIMIFVIKRRRSGIVLTRTHPKKVGSMNLIIR